MFPLSSLNCATHLLLWPATTAPSQPPCLKQSPFQPHFTAIRRLCECGWRIKCHDCHHTEKGLGEADAGSHLASLPSSVTAICKATWGREECCAVEDMQVSQHGSGMPAQLPALICVMPLGRRSLGTLFAPSDGGLRRRGSHGQRWSNGD